MSEFTRRPGHDQTHSEPADHSDTATELARDIEAHTDTYRATLKQELSDIADAFVSYYRGKKEVATEAYARTQLARVRDYYIDLVPIEQVAKDPAGVDLSRGAYYGICRTARTDVIDFLEDTRRTDSELYRFLKQDITQNRTRAGYVFSWPAAMDHADEALGLKPFARTLPPDEGSADTSNVLGKDPEKLGSEPKRSLTARNFDSDPARREQLEALMEQAKSEFVRLYIDRTRWRIEDAEEDYVIIVLTKLKGVTMREAAKTIDPSGGLRPKLVSVRANRGLKILLEVLYKDRDTYGPLIEHLLASGSSAHKG